MVGGGWGGGEEMLNSLGKTFSDIFTCFQLAFVAQRSSINQYYEAFRVKVNIFFRERERENVKMVFVFNNNVDFVGQTSVRL